ncbi:MAG: nuclear transport factor 2 family protein [Deltaproteobacteria bacterium]|nr:nuclear transport factor 2 family protein [Deltaproteobacteria bacterium]
MYQFFRTEVVSPTIAIIWLSMVVFAACGEETADAPMKEATPSPVQKRVKTTSVEDSPLPEFTDLSVHELLREWVNARNNQNFEAYSALYATRFDGVDMRGPVPVRFVREQWLGKEEKRFGRLRDVAISKTIIELIPGGADVSIREKMVAGEETVESQKQLLIVAEDGRLKIARERILEPDAVMDTGFKRPDHKLLDEFFFVLDNRYVVFSTTEMNKDGALFVNDTTALKRARRNVVPRKFRQLLKRKFVVGYQNGTTSVMGITDTRAIAKYAVHGAIENYWKKQGLSEVEMGELLWELASDAGSVYLVGILKETKRGALWAHPVRPRVPEIYKARNLDKSYIKNIMRRFRKRRESKKLQALYESFGLSGIWMDYEPMVCGKMFKSPRGNRRFAAVSISSGKGCGGFYGYMQGLFHMQRGTLYDMGSPAFFFQDPFIDNRDVIQTIDIDHDGVPEFIGKNKLMYKVDEDWFVYEIKIPQSDCPC